MNQSTPTSGPNTRPSVEGPSAAAPALAYTNPQPRLPHSEASPPEQPETFVRRARRVRLGSHRLKTGFLSLCTFGRAWTRREDVLEIGIKQGTLAGDLECKRNTLIELLRDLKATGYVQVLRRKYHSVIRIFLTPQQIRVAPKLGATEIRDAPKLGAADAPKLGATKVFRSCTDVQQQQQHPGGTHEATEKQLSGIASMAAELGIPKPEPQDRLAADVVFRELRQRVEAQRAERQAERKSARTKRRRHRIVPALHAGGVCEVCGEPRPDPKGTCPGER